MDLAPAAAFRLGWTLTFPQDFPKNEKEKWSGHFYRSKFDDHDELRTSRWQLKPNWFMLSSSAHPGRALVAASFSSGKTRWRTPRPRGGQEVQWIHRIRQQVTTSVFCKNMMWLSMTLYDMYICDIWYVYIYNIPMFAVLMGKHWRHQWDDEASDWYGE